MNTEIRALHPGVTIHKRYKIEKLLGAGGFGITYQAYDSVENCKVALKEYMPVDIAARRPGTVSIYPAAGQQEYYEKFRTRFLEEARVIYQFSGHPNIIRVKHLFYENNTAYYAMEFMEGQDLGKRMISGVGMDWNHIAGIIGPVVEALEIVHQTGLVHCDISPDNIFIQSNGQVKLIDFGAAKQIMKGQSSIVILKKGYAPPEQFTSTGKLGTWTDIYALGVTIYKMYTGKMPPQSPERLTGTPIIWPSEMGCLIPSKHWEYALRRALSLQPEERYHSVREFWNEMNKTEENADSKLILEGVRGAFRGRRIHLSGDMYLGTDMKKCRILYPPGSAGISRVHLRFQFHEGAYIGMDMGSTYGTYLNGQKMKPGLVYPLFPGAILELGDRQMFRIEEAERS